MKDTRNEDVLVTEEVAKERVTIQNLLTVKSIVTIMLTVVFCILAAKERITGEQFLTIFSVVIAFYFGTQHEKNKPSD